MWKYLKVNIFLWLWPFPLVFPAPPKSIGLRRRYFLSQRRHPISNPLLHLPRSLLPNWKLPPPPWSSKTRSIPCAQRRILVLPGHSWLSIGESPEALPCHRFASRKMNNLLTVFFLPSLRFKSVRLVWFPFRFTFGATGQAYRSGSSSLYSAWTNYFVSSWLLHSHIYVLFLFSHQKDRFSFICDQIRLPNQIIKEQSSVSQKIWWVCSFCFLDQTWI